MSGNLFHIIVPAYREAQSIGHLRLLDKRLSNSGKNYQLYLVDDGSDDETYEELANFASGRENVEASGYSTNRGKGYAIRRGFQIIDNQPDYVCFYDADGDISSSSLIGLMEELENSSEGVLAGSKQHEKSEVNYPGSRMFLSHLFSLFTGLYLRLGIRDTQTGLKGFKYGVLSDIIQESQINGYAFDTELIFLAKKNSYRVEELPVDLNYTGGSSLSFLDMIKIVRDSFLIGIRHR